MRKKALDTASGLKIWMLGDNDKQKPHIRMVATAAAVGTLAVLLMCLIVLMSTYSALRKSARMQGICRGRPMEDEMARAQLARRLDAARKRVPLAAVVLAALAAGGLALLVAPFAFLAKDWPLLAFMVACVLVLLVVFSKAGSLWNAYKTPTPPGGSSYSDDREALSSNWTTRRSDKGASRTSVRELAERIKQRIAAERGLSTNQEAEPIYDAMSDDERFGYLKLYGDDDRDRRLFAMAIGVAVTDPAIVRMETTAAYDGWPLEVEKAIRPWYVIMWLSLMTVSTFFFHMAYGRLGANRLAGVIGVLVLLTVVVAGVARF